MTIYKNNSLTKITKLLHKNTSKLINIVKRPSLKRQNGIPRNILEFGNYGPIRKSLLMEWWEMLELHKEIYNNTNNLKLQQVLFNKKKFLIKYKNSSMNKKYTDKQKSILIKWANDMIYNNSNIL